MARPSSTAPPRASWPLFGRANELARLGDLFSGTERLITLVGTAGVGKTRLAREAIVAMASASFCDLTETRTEDEVCRAIARELSVVLRGREDLAAELAEAIADRGPTLLVLDNCEQAIDAVAPIAQRVLDACNECRILATSRERLNVAAEIVVEVKPLPLPTRVEGAGESDPVRLFREIARRRAPLVPLGDDDVPVIAEIVRKLDGIPLAIELAAARLSVVAPNELLQRLDSTFDVLKTNARDLPTRQTTLRGAIEWSWSLLSERERVIASECSVFRGGFTLAAAEAVCSSDAKPRSGDDVIDVIHALRDKSLLHASSEETGLRFGMYQSIRELAREKLSTNREPTIRKHASYFARHAAELLRSLNGPTGTASLRTLGREIDNLLGACRDACALGRDDAGWITDALRVMVALYPFFLARGPVSTYVEMLAIVLERAEALDVDGTLRARALAYQSFFANVDPEGATALAETTHDLPTEIDVLLVRAAVRSRRSQLDEASADYVRVLELARACGDRVSEARALGNLAILARERGRVDEAEPHARAAIEAFAAVEDVRYEAYHRATLASVLHMMGRLEEASTDYEDALERLRKVDDRRLLAICLANSALLFQELGSLDQALAHQTEALSLARMLGLRVEINNMTGYLGGIHHELGNVEEASRLYRRATDALAATHGGDVRYAWLFLARRSTILADAGEIDEATDAIERATERLRACEETQMLAAVAIHRGHLDLARAVVVRGRKEREAHVEAARRALDSADADVLRRSDDVRFAHRMLARRLESHPERTIVAVQGELTVTTDGSMLALPDGTRVKLETRPALRALLLALVHHRTSSPGASMPTSELVARGWPNERMKPKAGADRLYMAMSRLRQLGLRDLVKRRDDGYLLDPDVPMRIEDAR